MEYIPLLLTTAFILFMALIIPGPDFLLTVKNSLQYSRKTGVYTAVGLGFGIAVHILYCSLGLAVIISKSILLFNILKVLGAIYLFYIGVQTFLARSSDLEISHEEKQNKDISPRKAIIIGFLGNALNPKATLFFLSLFTLVISPQTPSMVLGVMSIMMVLMTMIWFSLVAIFFTQKRVQDTFNRFQKFFYKIFGSLLMGLGVKVALSER
jgi:RhtB (resistance to homoserine/threonine) family protein